MSIEGLVAKKDYIIRESAEKILYNGCHTTDGKETLDDVVELWHMVQAIPAADVRPVVHGEWTQKYDWNYECSNCEERFAECYNFCPNCGADMREVNNG